MDIKFFRGAFFKRKIKLAHHITQHIRCGLTPLPFGRLLPSIEASYMLKPLSALMMLNEIEYTIAGVFLNSTLPKLKCAPINLQKLRGHRDSLSVAISSSSRSGICTDSAPNITTFIACGLPALTASFVASIVLSLLLNTL